MVDEFEGSWDKCLLWALFAYREITVETFGFSPYEMLFGRPVRGPLALDRSTWLESPIPSTRTKQSVLQYMLDLRERIAKCHELATNTAKMPV